MKRLIDFGRKALFYVRVLSGYEERRIRSYRLQIQQRLQQAEERKAAIKKVPEQIILKEVRNMVEEMQALNKKLEETEGAINEYFKPIEKEAEVVMQMQLEREATTMTDMMTEMHRQALLEQVEAEKKMAMQNLEKNKQLQESAPGTTSQPER
nr:IIIB transcription factor [Ipomoea batatas]